MAAVRKKQDDKILKSLRELANQPGNKHCFDCSEKGVTYTNMTIGSFVCTSCSGILRGITPPHRVKSISMATFSEDEVNFLRLHGNEECAKTWLGLWDAKRALKMDHKDFMIEKYERKRYYLEPASPLKSIPSTTKHQQQQQQQQQQQSNTPPRHSTPPTVRQNGHPPKQATSTATAATRNGHFHETFPVEDHSALFKQCKPSTTQQNGHKQNGFADFGKDPFENGKHGTVENFADFEHNQIYNAAGLSVKPGNGFMNGNAKHSTPSVDKYAALKDLDEQFREIKIIGGKPDSVTNNNSQANPFKSNPFQTVQNSQPAASPWSVETSSVASNKSNTQPQPVTNGWTNGFSSPNFNSTYSANGNGVSLFGSPSNNNNGFSSTPYATLVPQQFGTAFGGPTSNGSGLNQPNGNYNPFMTGTVNSNNPFL